MSRFRLVAAGLAALAWTAHPSPPREDWGAVARSVTIYRDSYGVPHVFGPTDASVVFGYLYAQAEDNFRQVEDNYIQAYDHRTGTWSAPVRVGDGGSDSHNYPTLVQANDGHLLVFRSLHNTELRVARSPM